MATLGGEGAPARAVAIQSCLAESGSGGDDGGVAGRIFDAGVENAEISYNFV